MKGKIFIFWSAFILAAIIRIFFSFSSTSPDIGECLKKDILGEGVLVKNSEKKENSQSIVVKPVYMKSSEKFCAVNFLIRISTDHYPEFSYGDKVSFRGKINSPSNFKSDSGRMFDYKNFLKKDDVYFEMKVADVSLIESAKGISLKRELYKIKKKFVDNIDAVLGEPHSALASGLVVGEKNALGKELIEDFRTVGLIHIVVLSGYNITIIGDATKKILSRLPRMWGIAIGSVGIVLFGVMVGGGATVVRSCIMACIALSADLMRRDYDALRALCLTGLAMIIENPMIVFHDPSFQLSFLATFGLIILSGPIERKLFFITETFGLRGIVGSTISTQIFVSPYILYMMGQISLIGTLVNIIVLPFIPLTMLVVFLTGVSGIIFHPLSVIFGWISFVFLNYELWVVEIASLVPMASIDIPVFSFGYVILSYLLIACLIFLLKRKRFILELLRSSFRYFSN